MTQATQRLSGDRMQADPRWILLDDVWIPHTAFEKAATEVEEALLSTDGVHKPDNIMLTGESGTGKSTVLDYVGKSYPMQRTPERTVRPILRVEVTHRPTTKLIISRCLREIGDPLPEKGTEGQMQFRLFSLMRSQKVRMLQIDEVQHFVELRSKALLQDVANWLKLTMDETKVSICLVGKPDATAILDQDEQLRGRVGNRVSLLRFDWQDEFHREEFAGIVRSYNALISEHFTIPDLASSELLFRCYASCGGLMRLLWETMRRSVRTAVREGNNRITLDDLDRANRKAVWDLAGVAGIPAPFSRDFKPVSSTAMLAKLRTLGIPDLAPSATSTRGSGHPSGEGK